jgi:sulfoxide reductase heme-binding subunit YedZ
MSLEVATTGPSALWYLTRGSGLILLAVLTASVALGILHKSGRTPSGWPRFVIGDLHRNLALLGAALLVIHILTAELDPFAPVGWLAVVVPFLSSYRPIWLGLGTLSVDILIAVVATSLLRSHLSLRLWRLVHCLTYLAWPIALLHSLGTGTDTRLGWVFLFDLLCLAVVLGAVWYRVWRLSAVPHLLKWSALAVTGAAVLAVTVFAAVGPLQAGWARSAGTPLSLLAKSGGGATSGAAPGQPGQLVHFSGTFSGTLVARQTDTVASIVISGTVRGGPGGTLRVTLTGDPLPNGGLDLASGAATFRSVSPARTYRGPLEGLAGDTMIFALDPGSGPSVSLRLNLQAAAPGPVTGTLVIGDMRSAAPASGPGASSDSE